MKNFISMAFCWLSLLMAPFGAGALTVKQSNVTFNANRFDAFQVLGSFEDLTLEQVEQIRLDVGSFSQSIPLSAFKKKNNLYKYTAPKGEIGLTGVTINVKRKTFSAKGQNLRLSAFKNPLPVRLAAGAFDACTMLTFMERPKRWVFNGKRHSQSACLIADVPKAEPERFFVDTPQNVRIQARIDPASAFDKNSVELVEVNPSTKTPTLESLCKLVDDGNVNAGDDVGGDNVFSCIVPFNETTPRNILLTVRVRLDSAVVHSSNFSLAAVARLTEEAAEEAANAQQAAVQIWQERLAALGYGKKARRQTLRQVAKLPGVAKAGMSKDGFTIWIKYRSGIGGGLMLNPPGTRGGSLAPNLPDAARGGAGGVGSGASPRASADVQSVLPALFSRYTKTIPGAAPSITPASPTAAAQRSVGNNKVLIWDAYHADFAPFDEGVDLQQLFQGMQCPKFDVTYLKNEQATLASVKSFSAYGTIVLVTHGALDGDGQTIFLTQEKVDAASIMRYTHELVSGQLTLMGDVFAIRPSFIENLPGNFEGAIVYNGSCQSSANNSMANAFLGKGANTYYGFTRAVNSDFARNVAVQLFSNLAARGKNAGDAFSPIFPKTDLSPPRAVFTQWGDNKAIYSGQFRNGNFETGDMTAWQRNGDVRVVSALGEYEPNGKFMGLISTGLGLTSLSGSIAQSFCLPANVKRVEFNWNFSSEKFRERCNGQIDNFNVELVTTMGTHRLLQRSVSDMCAASSPLKLTGLHFDQGPQGDVWSTGWISQKIDISSLAAASNGRGATLIFKTTGAGDSTYDTVTLVDDIELVTQ